MGRSARGPARTQLLSPSLSVRPVLTLPRCLQPRAPAGWPWLFGMAGLRPADPLITQYRCGSAACVQAVGRGGEL